METITPNGTLCNNPSHTRCNHYPIQSVKLDAVQVSKYLQHGRGIREMPDRKGTVYVLKHRGANHPVVSGIFRTETEAEIDKDSIPTSGKKYKIEGLDMFCQGCGVGCYDEYEIVPFTFDNPVKIEVKSL